MVWEDQGLYFTLFLNSVAMVVCIAVGFVMHKSADNHRILRPRRPVSVMGAFWQFPKSLFTLNEDEVGAAVGIEGAIYCLLLKFCAGFMASCFIGTIIIVSICATDNYLNAFVVEFDPNECADMWTEGGCEDEPYCEWSNTTSMPANSTTNIYCTPKIRQGLFDFSVQNLTPEKWTLWLYAIACLLSAAQMLVFLHFLLISLKSLFRKAYVQPILVPDDFPEKKNAQVDEEKEKEKARAMKSYSALATVGARTVLVAGYFDPDDEDGDAKLLEDQAAVLDVFQNATLPFGLKKELANKEKKDNEDEKMKQATKEKNAESRKKESEKIKPDPIAPFAQFILPQSVVAIKEAPKKMIDLMAEEKAALDTLSNDVAAEQLEEEPEKNLPHKKRIPPVCCKAVPSIPYDEDELEKVREDLKPLIEEVPDQKFVGSVIFTFDTPLHALEFTEKFNEVHAGVLSSRMAAIVGPKNGVIWDNLTVSGAAGNIRWILMMILVVILTFFWGIPVAFLGSLSNLATLPGIGGPFAWLVSNIPVTILGILTAYLPTIVLTVFNIVLPIMLRAFTRVGGVQSVGDEDSTVMGLFFFFTLMSGIIIQAAIQGGLGQLAALISNPTKDSIFAFILAIVSPSGGYWFSFLITAGCLGTYLKLLLLAPFIISKLFVKLKLVGHQDAYDALFAPRPVDYAIQLAIHLFFFAIAMLFHSTVPFLIPFGFLYFVNGYLVERALLLDGGKAQKDLGVNFTMAKGFLGIVLWLHTIGTMGTVVVSVLKEHIPAIVISVFALAISIIMQAYMRSVMTPLVRPSVKLYKELLPEGDAQYSADQVAVSPNANAATMEEGQSAVVSGNSADQAEYSTMDTVNKDQADERIVIVPGIGPLEPWSVNDHGYAPTYSYFSIDEAAVEKIKAKDYAIDKQWYQKEGADAEPIPFSEPKDDEDDEKKEEKKDTKKKEEEEKSNADSRATTTETVVVQVDEKKEDDDEPSTENKKVEMSENEPVSPPAVDDAEKKSN